MFVLSLLFVCLNVFYSVQQCRKFEWQCHSGQCIRADEVCDTIKDCRDRSDEEANICHSWQSPNISNLTIKNGCRLGTLQNMIAYYESNSEVILKPNDFIEPHSPIKYECSSNHQLVGESGNQCINGMFIFHQPRCIRYCSSEILNGISFQTTCFRGSRRFPCTETLFSGTTVKITCQIGYEKPNYQIQAPEEIKCLESGEWSDIPFRCQQICGLRRGFGSPLIALGYETNATEVPWNVGIYRLKNDQFEHICGGTIINAKIVVSAAHCFWNTTSSSIVDKSLHSLAVGKSLRTYNPSQSEINSMKFSITEIYIPPGYQDANFNYQEDFAIVIIDGIIRFNSHVKPICLRYDIENRSDKVLPVGTTGIISGWGVDQDEMSPNDIHSTYMIVKGFAECAANLPRNITSQIGSKYCVGSDDRSTVCRGDSGAGFIVPETSRETGIERFYLWGIVSTAATSSLECLARYFTTFTNVLLHIDEIKEFAEKYGVREIESMTCRNSEWKCNGGSCIPKTGRCDRIVDCLDGSDELNCSIEAEQPVSTTTESPIANFCVLKTPRNVISKHRITKEVISLDSIVENFNAIEYDCPSKYRLKGPSNNLCLNGTFVNGHPKCESFCSTTNLLDDISIDVKCSHQNSLISCDAHVLENAFVTIKCREGYVKPDAALLDVIYCKEDGEWDQTPFRCEQECGTISQQIASKGLEVTSSKNISENSENSFNFHAPWHAQIYGRNQNDAWRYYCAGTIISPNLIITAAHCFSLNGIITDKADFIVTVGKRFRELDIEEPFIEQRFNISSFYIPGNNTEKDQFFGKDIAVVFLNKNITFTQNIRPICLYPKLEKSKRYPADDKLGGIAVYRQSNDAGSSIAMLSTVNFRVMGKLKCLRSAKPDWIPFISNSKICIRSATNIGPCQSDSGSGFFTDEKISGVVRYFLWGVLSVGFNQHFDEKCSSPELALITSVPHFYNKITAAIGNLNPPSPYDRLAKNCILEQKEGIHFRVKEYPSGNIISTNSIADSNDIQYECPEEQVLIGDDRNTCKNGSFTKEHPICRRYCSSAPLKDSSFKAWCLQNYQNTSCTEPILPGSLAVIQCRAGRNERTIYCQMNGEWDRSPTCPEECGTLIEDDSSLTPWAAQIYKKDVNERFQFICSGTIISVNAIITVAHCLWDWSFNAPADKSAYMISVGRQFRKLNIEDDINAQNFNISRLHIPETFSTVNYVDDFAIVTLDRSIQFSPKIKPICLPYDVGPNETYPPKEALGNAAVFRKSNETYNSSNMQYKLNTTKLRIIDQERCRSDSTASELNFITREKICTYSASPNVICKDSGSGFYIQEQISGRTKFILWGLISLQLRHSHAMDCDSEKTVLLTNVAEHLEEILHYA